MERINKWLLNNIFWISIYLAITGLLPTLMFLLGFRDVTELVFLIFNFSIVHFDFLRSDVFELRIPVGNGVSRYMYYLDYAFYVLFIISAFIYKSSGFKESKVLKFCYSIIFIFSITAVIFYVFVIIKNLDVRSLLSVLFLLKSVVVIYLSRLYLNKWKLERTYIDTGIADLRDFQNFGLKRAERSKRLFHLLFDGFLIIAIFSKFIFDANTRDIIYFMEDTFGERFATTLVFALFSSVYYLIFEGLFKSTPAKYLTQTSVVNLKNEVVSFSNILGRTLCRRIPFDAFSFFGKIGWHDSLAYSTVAKHERVPSKHKRIYIVFIIVLIALFLYRFLEESRFI